MTFPRTFANIPDITPGAGVTPWQTTFYTAVKQNLELLAGQRGNEYTALIRGDIATQIPNQPSYTGASYTIDLSMVTGTYAVPTLEDYIKLANTVTELRAVVADLLGRIK